jgi:2-methylisocitrate lyase-like PEP mutase family enzyme
VLYANAALQAALKASHEVLMALKQEGSLASVADRLAGFDIRQQTVSKPKFDELEHRYRGG